MAILSNTPTLSYIYVKNMVITYGDTPYNILNMYTMKSYIFWDASDPYKLIASNKMLEEKAGLYYIIYNNKGNPTEIPQTDLDISFSESGIGDLVTEKILGFQNTLDANEQRFSTIETDVNHIKTIVGESSGGDGLNLVEQFAKIEQDVDSIETEVSRIEREYGNSEELKNLRENTNIALLKLQSVLGLFSSDMQEVMKDNVLTDEEISLIETYKNNTEIERMALNSQIDKVILRLEMQGELENVEKLRTQKTLLNDAIDNLYSNIDIACTDKRFTNMEMATIISYFSTVGNKINETNSMINEFIFLESGGKLIEELARLTISQNEIKQSVSKSESDVEEVIVKLEKTIVKIDTYYYSSTSKEELKDGEWSTTAPTWVDGKFLWTKTITTYTDESTEESNPVCITGQQGESVSVYTWIMYADDENGNGISNDPTDKSYIGFAYNKETATESNNPEDYTWSLFKGKDGLNGADGEDGTSVKILGTYETEEELNQAHPNNNNGDGYIVDDDLFVWDGDEFINVGQIKGTDGLNAYLHIKYSNDGGETFTPTEGEEVGDYMGVYTDSIETDSTDVTKYTWKKIKGEDGVPGEKGADGKTYYTWIRYSDNPDGTNMYNTPNNSTIYIGIATNKETQVESDNPSDYAWSRLKGEDGLNGKDGEDGTSVKILGTYGSVDELNQAHPDNNTNGDGYIVNGDLYVWDGDEFLNVGKIKGEDGLTAYVHIKYSNDSGATFTPNNGEEIGDYMGIYADNIETDSTDVSKYKWSKIKGEEGVPGEKGEDGKTYYTWIRYSDNENGLNMYNTPNSSTEYIGIASNKETMTESDNPLDYTWSKFKGADGKDGVDGKDGTSVRILGSYSSVDELKQTHPDNNENGDGYIVDGNLWVWDGTEFINVGQIKGEDGLTAYVHIKYSNDGGITFTPTEGEEIGDYMGVYTDNTEEDSSNVADYNWKKIKGEDGIPGEKGEDGKTYYTWIRYSDNADGLNMYNTPNSLTVYIGIATNKDTPTESDNPSDYVWSKFKGDDGVDGRGITSITVEYYLSSSKTTQLDGVWSDLQPTWQEDWYLWIRNKIVYNNPTSTEYTTPILDETWESLKDLKDEMDLTKTEIESIKDTVSEHTVALDSITSRVESTETTITNITNRIESNVIDVVNMYYLSSNNEELKDGEWSTSAPTNIGSNFLWSKIVTYYADDTTSESDPICLTNDIDVSDGESGYTVILSDEIFIVQCDLDGNPL